MGWVTLAFYQKIVYSCTKFLKITFQPEKNHEFARRKANENITGSWKFLSDCVSEGKWEFNKTVTFNSDIISSGSI